MIDSQPQATTRLSHLRAYLAGTGATGSLIAGAMVVFLSLAALVAFRGLPFASSGGDFGSAYVGASKAGPPDAAARTLAAAPRNVASTPVPGAPAGAAGLPAPGSGGGATAGASVSTPAGATTDTSVGATPPATTGTQTPLDTTGGGPITNTVHQVDPSGTTDPVTQQLDNTVTDTLNNAGGAVGAPSLGDSVNDTLNNTTGGLLGGSGGNDVQGVVGGLVGGGGH
jgi:hypothetical protein